TPASGGSTCRVTRWRWSTTCVRRSTARQNEHHMRLTKHHGLGNDFLVLLDLDGTQPIDEDIARAVCDRHRGVGADGLIRVTTMRGEDGAVRFAMELR